jgi:hypothetical protein
VRAQIEGSTLWGASIAMLEKATLANGGIQQTNFDGYTSLRTKVSVAAGQPERHAARKDRSGIAGPRDARPP